jgi:hypothetical protein
VILTICTRGQQDTLNYGEFGIVREGTCRGTVRLTNMNRLLLLFATVILAGCARPGDHPISPNCAWSEEDGRSLDLTKYSDRRHLRFDAVTAEDVAIRWADNHFHLLPEYEQRRDQCMQTLFDGVAKHHGVDIAIVRQYSLERDVVVDTALTVSFGILYAVVAYVFARRIRCRFPPGEPGFWVMTLTMAIGVSLVAVMVVNLSSIVIEGLRLNSGHLSYRMDRLPWREHWVVLFVSGFVIFWLLALTRKHDLSANLDRVARETASSDFEYLLRHGPENGNQPDHDHKDSDG